MLKKKDIENNINKDWKFSEETLKKYKYGLCKFIIDKSYELQFSKETAACAMQIVNYFFIKNCYFNYDKLQIACAALSLSIKLKTSDKNNLNDVFKIYFSNKNSELEGEYVSKKKLYNLRNDILNAEIKIMKLFNYSLPNKFPFEYIYLYSAILYPNNEEEIYNIGIKVCIDSYFTYANNLYKNFVVALACIFFGAKFLDIRHFLEKKFENLNKMKYIHKLNMTENEFINALYHFIDEPTDFLLNEKGEDIEKDKDIYFNGLNLDKKLHPFLEMNDLLECIDMIANFYEDIKGNYDSVNKKNK